jgi:transposase
VVRRGELTDQQWALIAPLLPPQRPRTGRPAIDHRQMVSAILWLTRTGAPWRDLPERYGSWKTVYSRFRRWSEQGIWKQVFDALLAEAQHLGELDWELHHIDSTIVRAHQHAAGARKRGIPTPPPASS